MRKLWLVLSSRRAFASLFFVVLALSVQSCGSDDDACSECSDSQLCVQNWDGQCNLLSTSCRSKMAGTVDCSEAGCDQTCEAAICRAPLQCVNGSSCPGESARAFSCYGP